MNTENVLKALRVKRGMNQTEMAARLGLSRQRYNQIENNLLKQDISYIYDLLIVLGCNARERDEIFDALKKDYLSYH